MPLVYQLDPSTPRWLRNTGAWGLVVVGLVVPACGLYGVTGGLYGFLPKSALYIGCGSVALALLVAITVYFKVAQQECTDGLWYSFRRLDFVQKLLAILLPTVILACLVFMFTQCVALAFNLVPGAIEQRQLTVHAKKRSPQKHTCLYQAVVSLESQLWEHQCLTADQYATLRIGSNQVQLKETAVGYFVVSVAH